MLCRQNTSVRLHYHNADVTQLANIANAPIDWEKTVVWVFRHFVVVSMV
jgi:hypothetical protein